MAGSPITDLIARYNAEVERYRRNAAIERAAVLKAKRDKAYLAWMDALQQMGKLRKKLEAQGINPDQDERCL